MTFFYADYSETGIDAIKLLPAHWMVSKLKRMVDPKRPITYGIVQAGPNVEGGVPYIRPADMTDEGGVALEEELLKTSQEVADSYRRSTVRAGDLVCSIGPSFGKVMQVPESLDGANLTQGTARVAVSLECSSRYVFWLLRSPTSVQQWESAIGGATFRALNLEPLARTRVPLPPLLEQRAIAAFLDRKTGKIDALVEEQRRLIALLKEKRQAVISHAVTKGLDPTVPMKDSGVEWLGEIPAHWDLIAVRRLVDPKRRVTYGIVQPGQPDPEGRYMVRGQDYSTGWAAPENIFRVSAEIEEPYRRARLKPGDIVITIVGAGTGNTAVVPDFLDGANITQTTARIAPQLAKIFGPFLHLALQSEVGRLQVGLFQKGAAQPGLNLEHLVAFRVPIPPLDEQRDISAYVAEKLASLEALISEAEKAIILLQERRSALISAAVTGKIDVRGKAPEASEAA